MDLPADCISNVISFTSPKDAARSSLVSSTFKESADSDSAWHRFLPSDIKDIIAQSSSPHPDLNFLSMKQLFLHLSDHPLLIANGNMSFSLEKESGRKCYVVGAKGLTIIWGDVPAYWDWISVPESRFSQVAKLNYVWWFEVRGSLEAKLLSPKTKYAVFFLFKFEEPLDGFNDRYVEFSVSYEGNTNSSPKRVILDPPEIGATGVQQRRWMDGSRDG